MVGKRGEAVILHCPCCHAQFSVEAIIQDEAARELLGFKAYIPSSLWAYLSLFRSEKRALSWERALKLAKEVLELGETARLEAAMVETIEALRGKGGHPLKNHNYLKRVMESQVLGTGERGLVQGLTQPGARSPAPASKTDAAMTSLEAWSRG
jgi:hypothetical protein